MKTLFLSIPFAIVWLFLHRLLGWTEFIPPSLSDLATFGLAVLGGYVALRPPTKEKVRPTLYGFIGLALIGIVANHWQRSIESRRQENARQEQRDAEIRFSEDLKSVKHSSDSILEFVANPPKYFTKEQTSAFAALLLKNRSRGESDSVSQKERQQILLMLAPALIREMELESNRWEQEDRTIENKWVLTRGSLPLGTTPKDYERLRKPFSQQQEKLSIAFSQEVAPLMTRANTLREGLLVGSSTETQNDEDKRAAIIFAKSAAGTPIQWGDMMFVTNYLDKLVKKFQIN